MSRVESGEVNMESQDTRTQMPIHSFNNQVFHSYCKGKGMSVKEMNQTISSMMG